MKKVAYNTGDKVIKWGLEYSMSQKNSSLSSWIFKGSD